MIARKSILFGSICVEAIAVKFTESIVLVLPLPSPFGTEVFWTFTKGQNWASLRKGFFGRKSSLAPKMFKTFSILQDSDII